jgi:hypothetical protein
MSATHQDALEHFRNGHYRGLAARIEYAAGFDVPLEIAWDTLLRDGNLDLIHETFSKVFFEPLIKAFQSIGSSGKDAMSRKLKRIVIRNSGTKASSFKDGILTIDDDSREDWDQVERRAESLKKIIEGFVAA